LPQGTKLKISFLPLLNFV